jgi:dTMP kinase
MSQLFKKQGGLITFEGPEGAGKTTQLERLFNYFKAQKIPCIRTREPGGAQSVSRLRKQILHELKKPLCQETELFFFLADRSQHVNELIQPNLKKGKWILCDRYTDSTLAYQGGGRGFDLNDLRIMNRISSKGIQPTITILMDIKAQVGLQRVQKRGKQDRLQDRMEREALSFHNRVRQTYRQLAQSEPQRFIVLNASKSPDEIFDNLLKQLRQRRFLD